MSNFTGIAPADRILSTDAWEIVRQIRIKGAISRGEMAELTGLSRAKITTLSNSLVDSGILSMTTEGESTGGRRPQLLDFCATSGYVVGIDLGATSLEIGLADLKGELVARTSSSIDVTSGPEPVLGHVIDSVLALGNAQAISPDKILAIGLGVPGPVEFTTGLLTSPPLMPAWHGFPIRDFIAAVFPEANIIIDNDVNLMALGEFYASTAQACENFFFVKVGTGIGCGIICNGAIYRGSSGCAGDIGHICVDPAGPVCHCGNSGCLEALASGHAIARQAMEAVAAHTSPVLSQRYEDAGQALTAHDVMIAAASGDPEAIRIIQSSGRMIGEVLATLVNFYNPERIIIGGGVSQIGLIFLTAIRQAVLGRSLPLATRHLDIQYSELGRDAGVKGAVALAIDYVFQQHTQAA